MKKTAIGGQALIEGLLMIGPSERAMVNRLPDGSLYMETHPVRPRPRLSRIPIVRGATGIFAQLRIGMAAMMKSAELQEEAPPQEDATTAQDEVGKAPAARSGGQLAMTLTLVASLLIGVAFFILLPNLLVGFGLRLIGVSRTGFAMSFASNLIEAFVRIAILLGYMLLVRRLPDIYRVWQYHGAEHKTIACYEAGAPLEVEQVAAFSRFHPRCGTSFLFIIVFVSAILFALTGWHGIVINLLIRLALIPLVAGLAYEILRFSGRHAETWYGRLLAAPGLALQRLTTAEPDGPQIEVAIAAMTAVLPKDGQSDDWDQR